jgi:hypothetical protein
MILSLLYSMLVNSLKYCGNLHQMNILYCLPDMYQARVQTVLSKFLNQWSLKKNKITELNWKKHANFWETAAQMYDI